ncbi:MAG TPA: RNA methyltransferase [Gemmatimonadaceae bacterium]|nr:RNA methyltransferase [Gemmatimonadaceae bacterium]
MKLLTLARDLRRRKARERAGLFVAEGVRTVEELLRSRVKIRGVLTAPQLDEAPRGAALLDAITRRGDIEHLRIAERDFSSAAETESPQGVLAIAEIPERSLTAFSASTPTTLLVLDAVQDPGNVGTIVRTAAALGATATVALPGTVDLWNAKVVRSGMGAHFNHPAFHCTAEELAAFLAASGTELWGADARGEPVGTRSRPRRLALAVGNEGSGLTDATRSLATSLVALPIAGDVESLNVAVATGILLHVLRS